MADRILTISRLGKAYRLGNENLPVLQDLCLDVAAGELAVIMGPSGAGKTTLLNCVSGISTPDSGEVRLAGRAIDYSSEHSRTHLRRSDIGMIFQFFNLIPTLSVRENIALPLLISRDRMAEKHPRIDELLESIGMRERQDHLPSQLSGGEMQLTSIARALIHRPKLVLADEPTGNVNPRVGRSIMAILRQTAKDVGCGVLMVTHSPEHAAWADRVCFLKDGGIASELVHGGRAEDPAPIHQALLELGI